MKIIIYGLVAVLSFAGALAGALALTGYLTPETLERILGRGEAAEEQAPALPEEDALGSLARALKERETSLNRRETGLSERERALAARESELRRLESTVEERIQDLNNLLGQADNEMVARRQTLADTFGRMDPRKAAEQLQALPPEDAVAILRLMDEKNRAKIFDAMNRDEATRILRLFQEPLI
jgi:flagellar motility protein MotE (MotC chaperone)